MKHYQSRMVEQLESRTLLSAAWNAALLDAGAVLPQAAANISPRVAGVPANSSGGATINETPSARFTANIGSGNFSAPAKWGYTRLLGTIRGTYTMPQVPPDGGPAYNFQGRTTIGVSGDVTVSGTVRLPGLIVAGQASGALTLRNAGGSITLAVTGPIEPGFGRFPSVLTYVIAQSTGAFAGKNGSGSIRVTLVPSTNGLQANAFSFALC